MHEHDKIYLTYQEARPLIEEADVLLYNSKCWYSSFIKKAAKGRYSHVALASWHNGANNTKSRLETIEFNGLRGGGATTMMSNLFPEFSNQIDIYRPNTYNEHRYFDTITKKIKSRYVPLNAKLITNTMRDLTGLPYGWRRILWFIRRNMFFFRLFYDIENLTSDELKPIIYPVCSTAIAYCFSVADFDLVHERADEWTEPSNLSLSPMLNYLFTIR